jgi:hypothetical protein
VRNYNRQERAIKAKALPWKRWTAELADDLEAWLSKTVNVEGDINAARFGAGPFDMRFVRNYLRAQAEGTAEGINAATRADLAATDDTADVFSRARDSRAPTSGMGLATAATSFAATEAAKKTLDARNRTKTWLVTSSNSAHPELDGEVVPLGGTFSNGSEGPPADHPGCECVMEIS